MSATSINNVIGKRFIELLRVDSTNNYAMQMVQKGLAKHGDAYFAFEQTAGRGQFNRQWHSQVGENIILSIVLDTTGIQLTQQFILNMITALTVMQLFNNYTTEKIKIKWPNDVYCCDRKAAGILIENIIHGREWQFAIVGIGVNINQTKFFNAIKNPVSLKQLTGKEHNVIELAKQLCTIFEKNLQQLFAGNENIILKTYNEHLYKLNELVKFKQGSKVFDGRVKEVDNFGKLIVESGIEQGFESGQVEWL